MVVRPTRTFVATTVAAVVVPVAVLLAQQPTPVPDAAFFDVKTSEERFASILAAVPEYQVRLASLEDARDKHGACTPDAASQSIGDALLWAVDAQRQSDVDFQRGRTAAESCLTNIADDALEALSQQSVQVADMVKVFSGLPPDDAPVSTTLDQILDQARWVAVLKVDAPDLTELSGHLDAARAASSDPASFKTTADRVNRLLAISHRADDALRQTVACVVAPQQLRGVRRIVALVQPIQQQAQDLATVVKAARNNASACTAAGDASKPTASGPSWLPPPASTVRKPAAAMPGWLPDKDTPATQTATTRSADVVREARATLITEEAQRIEDGSRKSAEARAQQAQRASDEQKARETAAAVAPQDPTLAQQRTIQQQRNERRTSFVGLLGRVTATVGLLAAGVVAPPALAVIPAIRAMSGGGSGGLPSASTASLPPAVAAVAAAVAAARPAVGQANGSAFMPGVGPTTGSSASTSTAARAPGAEPSDPYLGLWQCTINSTMVDPGGTRTPSTSQTPFTITGGRGSYVIPTQTGDLVGRPADHQVIFEQSVPQSGGTCRVQIRLQPQGGMLTGTNTVTCSKGQQVAGTVQCHR